MCVEKKRREVTSRTFRVAFLLEKNTRESNNDMCVPRKKGTLSSNTQTFKRLKVIAIRSRTFAITFDAMRWLGIEAVQA